METTAYQPSIPTWYPYGGLGNLGAVFFFLCLSWVSSGVNFSGVSVCHTQRFTCVPHYHIDFME